MSVATEPRTTYDRLDAGIAEWRAKHPGQEISTAILNQISNEVINQMRTDVAPIARDFSQSSAPAPQVVPKDEPQVIAARQRRDQVLGRGEESIGPGGKPKQQIPDAAPENGEQTEELEIIVTAKRRPSRPLREEFRISGGDVPLVTRDLQAEMAELSASLPRLDLGPAQDIANTQTSAEGSGVSLLANAPANTIAGLREHMTPGDLALARSFESRTSAPLSNLQDPRVLGTFHAIQLVSINNGRSDRGMIADLGMIAGIESSGGVAPDRPNSDVRSPFQVTGDTAAKLLSNPAVRRELQTYGITPAQALANRDNPLIGAVMAEAYVREASGSLQANFGSSLNQQTRNALLYAGYNQGIGAGVKLGQAVRAVENGTLDPSTAGWVAMGIPPEHARANETYFFNPDGTAKTVNETMNAYTIATTASNDANNRITRSLGQHVQMAAVVNGAKRGEDFDLASVYVAPGAGAARSGPAATRP